MIGTPFVTKDEIHNRKIEHLDKKPWEQEARDDQGRKHFYGAFTGALRESSVGYKGTVGSKEGFQPKQFVSSRRDRKQPETTSAADAALTVKQDILEFMDEEDLGEHHLPGSGQQLGEKPGQTGNSLLESAGISSVRSNCGKIGREILRRLQGKQLNSVFGGDAISSEDEPSSLIKAKRESKMATKLDRSGLGYEPTQQELELARLQKDKSQAGRQFPGRPQQSTSNSKVIKMAEFNEDDGDVEDEADGEHMAQVYSRDDTLAALKSKSEFTEIQRLYVNLTNQKVKACQFVVGGLLKSAIDSDQQSRSCAGLLPLRPPPGYNPFAEAQNQKKSNKTTGKPVHGRSKLDAFSRSKILEGETGKSNEQSRLPDGILEMVPFAADSDKLKRFEAHYLENQGQLIVFDVPNNMMTGSQMRREREEFNKILDDFKEIQKRRLASYQVYTSKDKKQEEAKKKGSCLEIKMEASDWQPDRLLILRFNLQNFVAKRKINTVIRPAEQKPVGFRKAGSLDISGDDYFNRIRDQFGQTENGQEHVRSASSASKSDGDESDVDPCRANGDPKQDSKTKEDGQLGTSGLFMEQSAAKKALLDTIFNAKD